MYTTITVPLYNHNGTALAVRVCVVDALHVGRGLATRIYGNVRPHALERRAPDQQHPPTHGHPQAAMRRLPDCQMRKILSFNFRI